MAEVKTTVELPEDLMRQLKRIALERGLKLKKVMADALRIGLAHSGTKRRSLPPPIRLKGGFRPSAEDIERMIHEGRR